MRLYTKVCFKNWPHYYRTYYQELQPPYRRCDKAHVFRLWSYGVVVVLRWHRRAENNVQADEWALNIFTAPSETPTTTLLAHPHPRMSRKAL